MQHKQTAKTPILQRCELLTSMSKIVDDPSFQGIIPESFLHGYSSASYQVEGGYQQDGRGLSVWDENLRDAPTGNGNVACDSYNLWQEDVKLLQQYGATGYRFSISWSRVIPLGEWVNRFASSTLQPDHRLSVSGGKDDPINMKGIMYYSNLVSQSLLSLQYTWSSQSALARTRLMDYSPLVSPRS